VNRPGKQEPGKTQDSLCKINQCALCDAHLFAGLSEEKFCEVQNMVSKATYQPGEAMFREGDHCSNLYVLRSGQVKLTTSLPDGRSQILRLGVPGHFLGFEVVDHDHYLYTAEALTTVEACLIRQKDMLRAVAENPMVCRRIARTLTEELEQAEGMIRDLGTKNAGERIASFLLSLASNQSNLSENLPLHLARHEIAEMVGLSTETVSRIMAQLQREAIIIAPRGSIRILDVDRLRSRAGAI
jgi:CRP/FNR family transcriptional regulator